jgi:hypothetical protein
VPVPPEKVGVRVNELPFVTYDPGREEVRLVATGAATMVMDLELV